jgi:hypothetical protein
MNFIAELPIAIGPVRALLPLPELDGPKPLSRSLNDIVYEVENITER